MRLTKKARRAAFYAANAIGFLVLTFGHVHYGGKGLAFTIADLALGGMWLIHSRPADEPVTSDLPLLICMDLLAYFALLFDDLESSYNAELLSKAMTTMEESHYLLLAYLGLALFIFVGLRSKPYFMGIGGGIFGAAILMTLFTTGEWPRLEYEGNGMAMLMTFVVASAFYSACLYMASTAARLRKSFLMFTLPTVVCCGAWLAVAIGCDTYSYELSGKIAQRGLELPNGEFAWWRVVLTSAILLALAYAFSSSNEDQLELDVDAVIFRAWAVLIIGVRVLMSSYFPFSWLAMLVLVLAVCACVRNASQGENTLIFEPSQWLMLVLALFILMVSMLSKGLWLNVVVTVPLIAALYWHVKNFKQGVSARRYGLIAIGFLIMETIAWLCVRNNLIDGLKMLGMVAVFASATVLILTRDPVAGGRTFKPFVLGTCACVALLCWLSRRPAARVSSQVMPEGVVLSIEEARDDHRLTEVTYQWEEALGDSIVSETPLEVKPAGEVSADDEAKSEEDSAPDEGEAQEEETSLPKESEALLPIVADHLVVRVTDEYGAVSRYDYFFASWMHDYKQAREELGITPADSEKPAEGE